MDPFGKAHISNYEKYMGIPENASLLEIGCGIGRDVFQLIQRSSKIKRYLGVDVTRDLIRLVPEEYHEALSKFLLSFISMSSMSFTIRSGRSPR